MNHHSQARITTSRTAVPAGLRRLAATLFALLAVAALAPAAAEAKWGPGNGCGLSEGHHCYALAWRAANDLGSIDYADATNVNVPEWQNGSFVSQEQWIAFAGKPEAWIEMGQLEGYAMDCCTVRPFFAEETPDKHWHLRIAEGSGPNQYAHYLIYDTEQNGIWRMYWGGWTEVERYGGWGTIRFQLQEAGTEAADETKPLDSGKDEVARWINGSSPWYSWNGVTYQTQVANSFCLHHNAENQTEGDIEWSAGSC